MLAEFPVGHKLVKDKQEEDLEIIKVLQEEAVGVELI